jgi:serine/threonine protein kinase
MNIKPQNILVRETEDPTSFTQRYTAPEVFEQEPRRFHADIFSVGCVFLGMSAALHDAYRPDI